MAGQEWDWQTECDAAHSTTEATYPSLDLTRLAMRNCLSVAESNWTVETTAIGGKPLCSRWRIAYSGVLICSRMTNWKTMVMRALKRACRCVAWNETCFWLAHSGDSARIHAGK